MSSLSAVWGPACALDALVCETPAFRLRQPSITRDRSYDRTILRFAAPGERSLPTASYELGTVYAVLLDASGRVIARRGHDGGRQALLGELCTWAHDFYDDHLARAASLAYEVEVRLDVRRTILSGPLAPIDVDSEARQPWGVTAAPAEPDPLISLSFDVSYSRGYCEVMMAAASPLAHDGHRSELELSLLDQAGKVLATKWMSLSVSPTGIGYNDASISLEKRVVRQVASLALSARTEVRSWTRIGPISLASVK